jgi:hypothetical protein
MTTAMDKIVKGETNCIIQELLQIRHQEYLSGRTKLNLYRRLKKQGHNVKVFRRIIDFVSVHETSSVSPLFQIEAVNTVLNYYANALNKDNILNKAEVIDDKLRQKELDKLRHSHSEAWEAYEKENWM